MLEIIPYQERNRWNNIVKSFPHWDIYYLNAYAESFMEHGDGIPYLIYFTSRKLRITYVVMLSDISSFKPFIGHLENKKYFDYSTPYGYGGPLYDGLISEDEIAQFLLELTEYAQEHNIVSQFMRFHPLLKNYSQIESECNVIHLKKTVYVDTSSLDLICANFDRKNRNMIRKAIKNNVTISFDQGENISEFMNIYTQTMSRKNAEDYYFFDTNYFSELKNKLSDHLLVFYAQHENEIIASSIFFYNDQYMHYHLSGSIPKARSLGATNYILYKAAKWANQHDISVLHLGGGTGIEDTLLEFKKQFNKNGLIDFCIGSNIFLPIVYDHLVDLRGKYDAQFDASKPYAIKYRMP